MTEKMYSMREILDAAVKEIGRAQKGPAVLWHKDKGFLVAVHQGSLGEIWDAPVPATVKELAGLLGGSYPYLYDARQEDPRPEEHSSRG